MAIKEVETVGFLDGKTTPRKINIEHENDGLEDDFPFQMGVFSGSMVIFRGVVVRYLENHGKRS